MELNCKYSPKAFVAKAAPVTKEPAVSTADTVEEKKPVAKKSNKESK